MLKELRQNHKEGLLDISRGQFEAEVLRLEGQVGNLLVEKVRLRTSTYELAAKEIDTERWNKRAYAEDWSYIDFLASRLKEPSGATLTTKNPRNPDRQARWRKAVMKAYGVEKSEPAAVHLFGPTDNSEGHIWSTKNGIPLLAPYEEMLDDASIAIVPTKDGKDLMVFVLDEDERVREPDPDDLIPTGRALHGRTLKFLTDHRPSMRERYGVHGWRRDRLEYANMPFFLTPGNWIRETTLRKLAIRIGHMPMQEADKFVSAVRGIRLEDPFLEGNEGEAKEDEDEEKDEVFTSILQYAYRKEDGGDEEEDEEKD
ncbi:hypothetical protein EKO27_g8287 [Xylaria grammica]|uniref:HNH nuclease domain-containing protein n=1 Tax=Xylaria grammica TaxID=363999 RepID=A0A439CXS2_9PEZI|nr:hypothetical protein EKO27_g8287 [Xylaria grammica]